MKLTPVLTEKSLKLAKEGKYTFNVPSVATKNTVAEAISITFGVDTTGVRILKKGGEVKKSMMRRNTVSKKSQKKAIVSLKEKQKIDLFEEMGE
jgi:ribosomal protein L23